MNAFFARLLRTLFCIACLGGGLLAAPAQASFHLYQIVEIYSSADGTVQYVELFTTASGQNFPLNTPAATLTSTGGTTQTFRVATNYPNGNTANTHVLFATQGFANLGIVTPDYIIPDGFIPVGGGTINYAGVDSVTFSALPANGSAINRSGGSVTPAPTNFSGQTGTLQASFTPQAGFWYNPAESGRGYVIEIHSETNGSKLFIGGFMYDANGNAIWYASGPALMVNNTTYINQWQQYGGGQTLTGSYIAPTIVNSDVGALTIQFTSATDGMLTLPTGTVIPITRFPF
jgi:hypothetical protein